MVPDLFRMPDHLVSCRRVVYGNKVKCLLTGILDRRAENERLGQYQTVLFGLKKESTIVIGQQQATRIASNVGFSRSTH